MESKILNQDKQKYKKKNIKRNKEHWGNRIAVYKILLFSYVK